MTVVQQQPTERRHARRAEPRPVRLRLLRFLPTLIVLGLLVHIILPRIGSFEVAVQTMRTLMPWGIFMALGFEALSYVANGALLQSIVSIGGGKMRLTRAVQIEIAAGTVALVAAGSLGFGAAIYRWTKDSGVRRETALLTSWLPTVFDAITLAIFALIGALALLIHHQLSRTTEIALGIVITGLAAVVGTVFALLIREDWMNVIAVRATRLIKRIRPTADESVLHDVVEHAAETWHTLRRGAWIRPAIFSLLVLTFDLLCLRYSFLAARQNLFISTIAAGYGVPLLLGRASFLPGGIAVIEVAMAAIYGGMGVPAAVAVVVVLTYRLLSFWLPSVVGIPIAIRLESRRRRGKRKQMARH